MHVMLIVTHLLGTGHLSRTLTLARAFLNHGHKATLVTGGLPAPQLDMSGIEILQLPPLRSDGVNLTCLLDETGAEATPDYLSNRAAQLAAAITNKHPDALITELFPLGRRKFRDEFRAGLTAAHRLSPRSVILCSVRDILARPLRLKRAAQADDTIITYYDGVLVHSDPTSIPLDQSWPVSDRLAPYLHYTGYVAPKAPAPHPEGIGQGEILVSAGGGDVGMPLYRVALAAAHALPEITWRFLIGGRAVAERIKDLGPPPTNVILEPARPDFRQMLPLAAASVSMCGYNTALDLLQSGTPAVLVPFDAGKEVEQSLRAQVLARLPAIEILKANEITGARLADTLRTLVRGPKRPATGLRFDGAEATVHITKDMVAERK